MSKVQSGEVAMLVGKGGKRFFVKLEPGGRLQTHQGVIDHADLIDRAWGTRIETHLGEPYVLLEPTIRDQLLHIKRSSQIIYPKEIGYILLRLSVGPGTSVVEAGTGSGALTTAFAWAVGPSGHVDSYDRRPDMLKLAARNLSRLGLNDRVTLHERDVAEGFDQREARALFLDLPHAHRYLNVARAALSGGAVFGAILPTANQVSRMLADLEKHQFGMSEVCEILLRFYKPVAERLRPTDRMVAHTGFLLFARALD